MTGVNDPFAVSWGFGGMEGVPWAGGRVSRRAAHAPQGAHVLAVRLRREDVELKAEVRRHSV